MAALKYSRQRESIKHYLMTTKEHPTADTVYMHVKKEFPTKDKCNAVNDRNIEEVLYEETTHKSERHSVCGSGNVSDPGERV